MDAASLRLNQMSMIVGKCQSPQTGGSTILRSDAGRSWIPASDLLQMAQLIAKRSLANGGMLTAPLIGEAETRQNNSYRAALVEND